MPTVVALSFPKMNSSFPSLAVLPRNSVALVSFSLLAASLRRRQLPDFIYFFWFRVSVLCWIFTLQVFFFRGFFTRASHSKYFQNGNCRNLCIKNFVGQPVWSEIDLLEFFVLIFCVISANSKAQVRSGAIIRKFWKNNKLINFRSTTLLVECI